MNETREYKGKEQVKCPECEQWHDEEFMEVVDQMRYIKWCEGCRGDL